MTNQTLGLSNPSLLLTNMSCPPFGSTPLKNFFPSQRAGEKSKLQGCPQVERFQPREKETVPASLPQGTEHILFVDDEELILEMGKEVLESLGYKVTAARHATEALNLFRENPSRFDLVITDQTMPDLTGLNPAGKMLKLRKDAHHSLHRTR
jgi:PleD family two-component response regulator